MRKKAEAMSKRLTYQNRYTRNQAVSSTKKADETYYSPPMWGSGDWRFPLVMAIMDSVDDKVKKLEQSWGMGRLERLASPALALKFEQARLNWKEACNKDDHIYLVQKGNNLIAGWEALEKYAISQGHKPTDGNIIFIVAPVDCNSRPIAIIEHAHLSKQIDPQSVARTYTYDELCRIIKFWEEKMETVTEVKNLFHGSTIEEVKPHDKKQGKLERDDDKKIEEDEIPF
jgi:hypothetical protein|tara:strand:- start:502 stop:1188 length:687 start_codon:yes stop_codon:yes gene_type:complete